MSSADYPAIPRGSTYPSLMPGQTFDVYAQAYYDAARAVYEKRWRDNDAAPILPDWIVWPVLFLVHQFVELELKEIVRLTKIVADWEGIKVSNPVETHDISRLLADVTNNLKSLTASLVLSDKDVNFLTEPQRRLIEDLQSFGGGGEKLRYPMLSQKQGGGQSLPTS